MNSYSESSIFRPRNENEFELFWSTFFSRKTVSHLILFTLEFPVVGYEYLVQFFVPKTGKSDIKCFRHLASAQRIAHFSDSDSLGFEVSEVSYEQGSGWT